MRSLLALAALAFLAGCATSFGPSDVRGLSCTEIQAAQSHLQLERKAVGVGSLLGSIVVAVAAGPWAAVPVVLVPGLRGNRGEFVLDVAEVIKECEG